jgi:hypothetical protein
MVMNKINLIIVLFLLIGNSAFAQENTLNVYLEKNLEHRTGVDLVFENNSDDIILVTSRFQNFSQSVQMPTSTGIAIDFFHNNNRFTFNWGEGAPLWFDFSRGLTLIFPHSSERLFFNIGDYFRFPLPEDAKGKYEVSFLMNYIYSKFGSSELAKRVIHFETNRVTIVEPIKDVEKGE